MRNIFGVATLFLSLISNASAAGLQGVSTNWTVESYGQKGVALWYTPSTCVNGGLGLPPDATVTDHNRLFAIVTAAKLANAKMFFSTKSVIVRA